MQKISLWIESKTGKPLDPKCEPQIHKRFQDVLIPIAKIRKMKFEETKTMQDLSIPTSEIQKAIEAYFKDAEKHRPEDAEHKTHNLSCLMNMVFDYKEGKITIKDHEVIQCECEDCDKLLWE